MTPTALVQWLLALAIAAAAAALLSPVVINASMIVSGPCKVRRGRTALKIATLALGLAAMLCLVRIPAGWPDAPLVWAMFASMATAGACLIASKLQDGADRERLVLFNRVFIAIAALLLLLSGVELGSALAWGAAAVIVGFVLELWAYWRDRRDQQGRGPPPATQSNSPWRANR